MRDLILLAALCGVIPLIFRAPFVGLLAWIWVSLMNPHQQVYGFLHGAPLNMAIALATFAGWLGSREPRRPPANVLLTLLLLFLVWMAVCTADALDRAYSLPLLDRNLKTILMVFVAATLANTRGRIQAVIWAVVVSLGYYGVKGGGFTLLTGAGNHVFGPDNSMIADNNCLGLALVTILPLMLYLHRTSARALVRWALIGLMALTLVAVLGTYSRGALIALGASVAAMALRSRYGLVLVLVGALATAVVPSVMPPSWSARMSTIKSYNDDDSFESRVAAWRTSTNIALARPLTGGGPGAVQQTWIAQTYRSPGSLSHGRAAHSIYFQVLGDMGFVGLALYLSIVAATAVNTSRVLAAARRRPGLEWATQLARMLQVSLVGFVTGGAALSMAYYDGALLLFAMTAALRHTVRQATAEGRTASAPSAGRPLRGRLREPAWRRPQEPARRPVL